MFDGKLNEISAEKHIQGFEYFLELFEVEQVDLSAKRKELNHIGG